MYKTFEKIFFIFQIILGLVAIIFGLFNVVYNDSWNDNWAVPIKMIVGIMFILSGVVNLMNLRKSSEKS